MAETERRCDRDPERDFNCPKGRKLSIRGATLNEFGYEILTWRAGDRTVPPHGVEDHRKFHEEKFDPLT
jgi:hypothetical protein